MNSLKITSRISELVKKLEVLIREIAQSNSTRLPTVKELSKRFNVGSTTLCKVVRLLKDRGVLIGSQRNGIHVVPASLNATFELAIENREQSEPSKKLYRETLRDRILHDLYIGEFPYDHDLPIFKELILRYGVSYAVLSKALHGLISDGILAARKKRLRPSFAPATDNKGQVVIVAKTDEMSILLAYSPRAIEFWRSFESMCVQRELSLVFHTFDKIRQAPPNKDRIPAAGPLSGATLGYIVLAQDATFEDLQGALTSLERSGLPVALIDEVDRTPLPAGIFKNRYLRLFVAGTTTTPGRIVGNHLLKLGHRHAAYVTMFIEESWSAHRLQGLAGVFETAGTGFRLTTFPLDISEAWHDVFNPLPGAPLFDRTLPHFNAIQKITSPITRKDPKHFYIASLHYLWGIKSEEALLPLFKKVLQDRSITAWVAESDYVALLAISFLRSQGVRVPEDISVVGFDDTIEGLGAHLTSYNFNMPALVSAVVNHLLTGGTSRMLVKRKVIEIPGVLMARQTTGPAKPP